MVIVSLYNARIPLRQAPDKIYPTQNWQNIDVSTYVHQLVIAVGWTTS